MDITQTFPTSTMPVFSPGSSFIVHALGSTVRLLLAKNLDSVLTLALPSLTSRSPSPSPSLALSRNRRSDPSPLPPPASAPQSVTHVSLNDASSRLLVFCAKPHGVAYIFDTDLDGNGRRAGLEAIIEGGVEGLIRVEWARNRTGRDDCILAWSEEGLRLTIWDLRQPEWKKVIIGPKKQLGPAGHAWSSDGSHFFLAERHASKDTIAVYDADADWKQIHRLAVPTSSLTGLALSPSSTPFVAAYDWSMEYKLSIHLPPLTTPLQTFPPPPTPAQIEKLGESYLDAWDDDGMGVRCVAWHPAGAWVAIGGWDGKVRVMECDAWEVVLVLPPLRLAPSGTSVWKEPSEWHKQTSDGGIVMFHTLSTPATIPFVRVDIQKTPLRTGVSQLSWNKDGTMLLVRHDNSPTSTHLHPFPPHPITPPTIVLTTRAVSHAEWHPSTPGRLAICAGGRGVYLWDRDGDVEEEDVGPEDVVGSADGDVRGEETRERMECVGLPDPTFNATRVCWAPAGDALLLLALPTAPYSSSPSRSLLPSSTSSSSFPSSTASPSSISTASKDGKFLLLFDGKVFGDELVVGEDGMSFIQEEDEEEDGERSLRLEDLRL